MVPLPDRLRPSLLTPMALKTNSADGGGLALSKWALILTMAVSKFGAVAAFGSVGTLGVGVGAGAGGAEVAVSAAVGGNASVVGAEGAGGVSVAGLSATVIWSLAAIAGAGGGSDGAGGASFRGGGAERDRSGRSNETLIVLSSSASSKNAMPAS